MNLLNEIRKCWEIGVWQRISYKIVVYCIVNALWNIDSFLVFNLNPGTTFRNSFFLHKNYFIYPINNKFMNTIFLCYGEGVMKCITRLIRWEVGRGYAWNDIKLRHIVNERVGASEWHLAPRVRNHHWSHRSHADTQSVIGQWQASLFVNTRALFSRRDTGDSGLDLGLSVSPRDTGGVHGLRQLEGIDQSINKRFILNINFTYFTVFEYSQYH